jgi:crotonobetainyl-CoA:carnitine CoA-transferase CaiB-like acyl-CoA transferase
MDDPELGVLPIAAPVPKLSVTPGRIRHLGAELGSSTAKVLSELLGMDDHELSRLADEGVI